MSILVVGSVALDSVKTPWGEVRDVLGGSATYFAYAASFFSEVNLVAVVGEDFPQNYIDLLKRRSIDLQGLKVLKGKSFRWEACYGDDPNERDTICLAPNVFQDFHPQLPQSYRSSEYIFLANIDPELHLEVLKQIDRPKLVACDTMNIWIEKRRNKLLKTLSKVDILIVNDSEAKALADEPNLFKAAKRITSLGPKKVVVKKGEHGALLFSDGGIFSAPAYPLEELRDPTGAGDSFAGGFLGHLAKTNDLSEGNLRKAVIYGTVLASFTVEDFSLNRLISITKDEISKRYQEFKEMAQFK